jgi:hypothetical protein
MSPDEAPPGNGLLLFFRVDDFDMALKRPRGTPRAGAVPMRYDCCFSRARG